MTNQAQCQNSEIQEKFAEAQSLSASREYKEALKILREVEKEIGDPNPIVDFQIGFCLHATGEIDEAIEYHKRAVDSRLKTTALYNLACAYSVKKDNDRAFKYLKQSIESGYHEPDQVEHAKQDPDFKNIKEDPRWKDMVAMMENGGKMPTVVSADVLLGDWMMESGMKSGSKMDSERLGAIKITKDSFTMPGQGDTPFVMSYKLDKDAKPMNVDFKIESGPMAVGAKAKGIIKMHDDGKMSLCYDPNGEGRPEKFLSTEENGYFVFKMKKGAAKTEVMAKKKLSASMQGKWKCIKGIRSGAEVGAERMASVITINDKTINIPVGEGQAFVMSYSIDESKSPATIDMKIEEGPAPEGTKAVGIVKMKDGKFFLCYDSTGANRPDKFEAEDEGMFYFEMEKAEE